MPPNKQTAVKTAKKHGKSPHKADEPKRKVKSVIANVYKTKKKNDNSKNSGG